MIGRLVGSSLVLSTPAHRLRTVAFLNRAHRCAPHAHCLRTVAHCFAHHACAPCAPGACKAPVRCALVAATQLREFHDAEHLPLLPLARLWAKTSAKGTPYMVGGLGLAKSVLLPVREEHSDGHTHELLLLRRMMPRIKQQPKAHHPSGTRRLLRTGTRYRSAE